MGANVKPFVHWAIYRSYAVRYTKRTAQRVSGVITTPEGPVNFQYDPENMVIHLPAEVIRINEHGWEIKQESSKE